LQSDGANRPGNAQSLHRLASGAMEAYAGHKSGGERRDCVDRIILTYPNVTLEYAEYCKNCTTRIGTYNEILSLEIGYCLKIGDEAGFLNSPYIFDDEKRKRGAHRKYPIMTSTVIKNITPDGVLFEDKFKNDPLSKFFEGDVFIPYDDLFIKPVNVTRIKFNIHELLNGTAPTEEFDETKGKYIHRGLFSGICARSPRLDKNLSNFIFMQESLV